eukprot:gene4448-14599_t
MVLSELVEVRERRNVRELTQHEQRMTLQLEVDEEPFQRSPSPSRGSSPSQEPKAGAGRGRLHKKLRAATSEEVSVVIDGCELLGIPSDVFLKPRLRELVLSYNLITAISPLIETLRSVQILRLDHNQVDCVPPEIGKLSMLQLLDLEGNQVSSLPAEVGLCIKLKYLNLLDNPLKGAKPGDSALSLPPCPPAPPIPPLPFPQISSLPAEFGLCIRLKYLNLLDNPLNGAISSLPAEVGLCIKLKYLNLLGNPLNGAVPGDSGLALHEVYYEAEGSPAFLPPKEKDSLVRRGTRGVLSLFRDNLDPGIHGEVLNMIAGFRMTEAAKRLQVSVVVADPEKLARNLVAAEKAGLPDGSPLMFRAYQAQEVLGAMEAAVESGNVHELKGAIRRWQASVRPAVPQGSLYEHAVTMLRQTETASKEAGWQMHGPTPRDVQSKMAELNARALQQRRRLQSKSSEAYEAWCGVKSEFSRQQRETIRSTMVTSTPRSPSFSNKDNLEGVRKAYFSSTAQLAASCRTPGEGSRNALGLRASVPNPAKFPRQPERPLICTRRSDQAQDMGSLSASSSPYPRSSSRRTLASPMSAPKSAACRPMQASTPSSRAISAPSTPLAHVASTPKALKPSTRLSTTRSPSTAHALHVQSAQAGVGAGMVKGPRGRTGATGSKEDSQLPRINPHSPRNSPASGTKKPVSASQAPVVPAGAPRTAKPSSASPPSTQSASKPKTNLASGKPSQPKPSQAKHVAESPVGRYKTVADSKAANQDQKLQADSQTQDPIEDVLPQSERSLQDPDQDAPPQTESSSQEADQDMPPQPESSPEDPDQDVPPPPESSPEDPDQDVPSELESSPEDPDQGVPPPPESSPEGPDQDVPSELESSPEDVDQDVLPQPESSPEDPDQDVPSQSESSPEDPDQDGSPQPEGSSQDPDQDRSSQPVSPAHDTDEPTDGPTEPMPEGRPKATYRRGDGVPMHRMSPLASMEGFHDLGLDVAGAAQEGDAGRAQGQDVLQSEGSLEGEALEAPEQQGLHLGGEEDEDEENAMLYIDGGKTVQDLVFDGVATPSLPLWAGDLSSGDGAILADEELLAMPDIRISGSSKPAPDATVDSSI